MNRTLVRCVRMKNFLPSFFRSSASKETDQSLTAEQKAKLKGALSKMRADEPRRAAAESEFSEYDGDVSMLQEIDMDSIRARGFMKYRYNYEPPSDLEIRIKNLFEKHVDQGSRVSGSDFKEFDLTKNDRVKFQFLDSLGKYFRHTIPNPELHRMKTVEDVIEFYRRPVSNLTVYAKMARDNKQTLPRNLHVIEHPLRFHPDDKHAYHGGITAFPGRGGQVFGLRNKRIYRQFEPKKDWFEYEDQSFDYTRIDKDMPWDPEIAKRMDRYPSKKYRLKTKSFSRL